ncbi:hypothetical protein, partial [Rugamonas violacea]|uniref:hypothetical protein n=1 Tax=Rugamonas sp. CCM 8940 TaxID=2765359 RepID=UPI001F18128B
VYKGGRNSLNVNGFFGQAHDGPDLCITACFRPHSAANPKSCPAFALRLKFSNALASLKCLIAASLKFTFRIGFCIV